MITPLDPDGRLLALSHPYAVDGTVSWHGANARGFAPINCYVLVESDSALLVETGLGIHQDALFAEIEESVGDRELSLLLLRQGEFDSVFNLLPIVHRFAPKVIYGQYETPLSWGNFRNDIRMSSAGTITYQGESRTFEELEAVTLSRSAVISLGRGHARILDVFRPELLLLNTHWVYDAATGTLFTSDSFAHVVLPSADAGWVVTAQNDATTAEDVADHLRSGRFWWLAGAQLDAVRRDVAGIFERYEVETIAPAYGAILQGADVVRRHVALLDDALAEFATLPPVTSPVAA
jgi:hypothetical protein